jgi:hypothetical protein
MNFTEIKIAQINHGSSYLVAERVNGGAWAVVDNGVAIDWADEFADHLWTSARDDGQSVRCFYEWSNGKRTYRT